MSTSGPSGFSRSNTGSVTNGPATRWAASNMPLWVEVMRVAMRERRTKRSRNRLAQVDEQDEDGGGKGLKRGLACEVSVLTFFCELPCLGTASPGTATAEMGWAVLTRFDIGAWCWIAFKPPAVRGDAILAPRLTFGIDQCQDVLTETCALRVRRGRYSIHV
jgi:hypothetical protein